MNKEKIENFLSEMNVLLKHGAKLPNISEEDEVCITTYLFSKSIQDALHFIVRYHGLKSYTHAVKRLIILEFRGHKLPVEFSKKLREKTLYNHLLCTYFTAEQIASLLSNPKGFSKPVEHILVDSITEMSFQDAFLITKRLGYRTETLFEVANVALEYEYQTNLQK